MKLAVFYGKSVNSWCNRKENEDDDEYQEWAPSSHQINFSNEFAPGWKNVGGSGRWFMGCVWIKGLTQLTRLELQDILKNVVESLGEHVYGTTLENSILSIEKKMDRLIHYIVSLSPKELKDITINDCKEFLKYPIKINKEIIKELWIGAR